MRRNVDSAESRTAGVFFSKVAESNRTSSGSQP